MFARRRPLRTALFHPTASGAQDLFSLLFALSVLSYHSIPRLRLVGGLRPALLAAISFLSCVSACGQTPQADIEYFEKKVRPILVDDCGQCHGRDAEPLEGGLALWSRPSILAGGDTGPAILPGDPEHSLLIDAVNYRGLYEMPPDSKLPREKIEVLTEWVRRGAPWPDERHEPAPAAESKFDLESRRKEHWAWQPIQHFEPPAVTDADWPADPLDRFILAKLEDIGLQPAPEADPREWIRRVYFDLIGLPPSVEAVNAFLTNTDIDAYERLVEQLLASDRFGENWARRWMDLIRYAETYGHEYDYEIAHAYQYRDYLIRAFNADVPYDQLIREHIAGDLLTTCRHHATADYNESILGTGFWFLGEATHGPVDVKADEAGRIDNQIDVLSKTFLGLTVSCARCHDHKFDAISSEDYYALSGFLQSSRRQTALLDPGRKIKSKHREVSELLTDGNKSLASWLEELRGVSHAEWVKLIKNAIEGENEIALQSIDVAASGGLSSFALPASIDFPSLLESEPIADVRHPLHALSLLRIAEPDKLNESLAVLKNSFETQRQQRKQFTDQATLFEDFRTGIPDDWFVTGWAFEPADIPVGISISGSLLAPKGWANSGRLGEQFQGVVRSPTFELTHDKLVVRGRGVSCLMRLVIDGYELEGFNSLLFLGTRHDLNSPNGVEWFEMAADVRNYKGHRAYLELVDLGASFMQIDEIWLANESAPAAADEPSAFTARLLDREPGNRAELIDSIAHTLAATLAAAETVPDTEMTEILSALAAHSSINERIADVRLQVQQRLEKLAAPIPAIAMADGTPEDECVFIRGNSKTLGPQVHRRFLSVLNQDADRPQKLVGSGRLELANQIASADNPLTSRVMANRIWKDLIGRGIVSSVDNFGVLGERPSHPELLDYLAREFSNQNWSIKQLVRRIVLSRTYRMASAINEHAERVDPDNRLLHRAHVKRLPAEAVRDSILQVAGSLNLQMYGPGVQVYLTEFMQGRGRPEKGGPIDGHGRRSIYIQVRRNFLSPMMLAFDAPIPFNTIGLRHESNVPAQALTLLNDPFVVEQAGLWAKRMREHQLGFDATVDLAFQTALSRHPSDAEMAFAREFFADQLGLIAESEVQTNSSGNRDENSKGQSNDESNQIDWPDIQSVLQQQVWSDFCHVIFNMKEFIFVK